MPQTPEEFAAEFMSRRMSGKPADLFAEIAALKRKADQSEMLDSLYRLAIECVDRVFQVDSSKPPPILPDFLYAGDCKFRGVIKLAEAYKAKADQADRLREACETGRAALLAGDGHSARVALDILEAELKETTV